MYIFYIFAIIFFILGIILRLSNNRNKNTNIKYLIKSNPMTETEQKFVTYLKVFTDKYNLIILPQVQLQSIFKTIDKKILLILTK